MAHERDFQLYTTIACFAVGCALFIAAVRPVSEDIAKREAAVRSDPTVCLLLSLAFLSRHHGLLQQ